MGVERAAVLLSYTEEARKLRKEMWSRFFAVVMMAVYLLMCAPWMAWSMVAMPVDGEWRTKDGASTVEAISRFLDNRVVAAECLAACAALLALVATINVALAARAVVPPGAPGNGLADRGGVHDQLRDSIWRSWLAAIAMMAAALSMFAAAAAWTDNEIGQHAGTAVLALSMSLFAAFLAAAIQGDSDNAADRALEQEGVRNDLNKIATRRLRLPPNSAPRQRPYLLPGALLTVVLAAQLAAGIVGLELIGLATRGYLVKFWEVLDAESLWIALYAAGLLVFAVTFSVSRWATFRSEGSRWAFKIRPYLLRAGYVVLAALFCALIAVGVEASWRVQAAIGLVFFIGVGSGPLLVWFGFGVTASKRTLRFALRHRPLLRFRTPLIWFMRPFWGIVTRRLDSREDFLRGKLVELEADDHADAVGGPLSGADTHVQPPVTPIPIRAHADRSRDWLPLVSSVTTLLAVVLLSRNIRR